MADKYDGRVHATKARHARDWLSRAEGQGEEFLALARRIKNIWVPYGE